MSGIIIDVIILAMILAPAVYGFHKGLIKMVYGVLASIVAIVVALILYKPVAGMVVENTGLDEYFSSGIYNILSNQNFSQTELINPENTKMSNEMVEIINKYLSEAIQQSSGSVFTYISEKISIMMVNLLVLICIIIIIKIILSFIKIILDIVTDLPILKQIDKSGGLAVGFLKGFITVYIILAIFSTFSPMLEGYGIIGMIENSKVGALLYNNNIILKLISRGI